MHERDKTVKANDRYKSMGNDKMVATAQQTPLDSTTQLGNILREKRKSQGLTQREVADHCGVSTRFVSEVERGKTTAEIGKVFNLLKAVGVDLFAIPRS